MKIVSVVGARPQFVKLAPLDKRLRAVHEHVIINTGQHYDYDLSGSFFEELNISRPDYDLEVGSGPHGRQTAGMLEMTEDILSVIEPDLVLVYGDTNSTLAGALAAVKMHIPVAHVEAGYRSGDLSMPEEVNRLIVDRIARIHFAPTTGAVDNLRKEGVDPSGIFPVGNLMAESLLVNRARIKGRGILGRIGLQPRKFALLTVHRPENTDSPARLAAIMAGVEAGSVPVIFPVHPRTAKLLDPAPGGTNVVRLGPLNYLDCLALQAEARVVLTDSGGIQEESFILGTPCLTLRYNTERISTLRNGANQLVGADQQVIAMRLRGLLSAPPKRHSRIRYWDRQVSARILKVLESLDGNLSFKSPQVFEPARAALNTL